VNACTRESSQDSRPTRPTLLNTLTARCHTMDEKDGSYPPANTETNQRYSVVSEGPREEVFRTGPVGIIGKHRPREIVRIERDYAAGETVVQYWAGSLPELDGRVTPTQHAQIVNELNGILASASNPYKSILDNVLAILSLYLSTFLYKSHFQKVRWRLLQSEAHGVSGDATLSRGPRESQPGGL
jgi:hypothetical protein